MINTGLLLRLPLESEYSALRRFIIANRSRSLQDLRGELVTRIPDEHKGAKLALVQRAQAWEKEYCDAYGIDYVAPHPLTGNSELRNCPDCARIGYHSVLYQYPWVRRCPLHDRELVTSCPVCHQSWPVLSHLLASDCPCCSARGVRLVTRGKSDLAQRIDEQFGPVYRLVERHEKAASPTLSTPDATIHEFHTHQSVTPWYVGWPSLLAHNDSDIQRIFERFGIRLARVHERSFPLDPVQNRGSKTLRARDALQRTILQREAPRLRTQLWRRFGPDHTDRTTRLMFNQPVSIADVAYLSWINWSQFVNEGRYPTRHLSYIDGCTFFRGPHSDVLRPGAPCVMTHLTYERENRYPPLTSDGASRCRTVPKTLQDWLYTCDLWWTFIAMLHFFDSAAFAMNLGWHWAEFIRNLKEEGDPSTWRSPRYYFFESAPGMLGVRVLYRVASFSFDNVELAIEQSTQSSNELRLSGEETGR